MKTCQIFKLFKLYLQLLPSYFGGSVPNPVIETEYNYRFIEYFINILTFKRHSIKLYNISNCQDIYCWYVFKEEILNRIIKMTEYHLFNMRKFDDGSLNATDLLLNKEDYVNKATPIINYLEDFLCNRGDFENTSQEEFLNICDTCYAEVVEYAKTNLLTDHKDINKMIYICANYESYFIANMFNSTIRGIARIIHEKGYTMPFREVYSMNQYMVTDEVINLGINIHKLDEKQMYIHCMENKFLDKLRVDNLISYTWSPAINDANYSHEFSMRFATDAFEWNKSKDIGKKVKILKGRQIEDNSEYLLRQWDILDQRYVLLHALTQWAALMPRSIEAFGNIK